MKGAECVRLFGSCGVHRFVPKHASVRESDVEALRDFVRSSRKILVVTGAGVSTESGIPDYRSEGVGLYARSNHRPIQHQEFVRSPAVRQRYWARNYVAWPRFSTRAPNPTHLSLRNLEADGGKISAVVTQNVDGLHAKAGSKNVVELHGSAFRVTCLDCRVVYDRHRVQDRLRLLNPAVTDTDASAAIRPDGDVDMSQETVATFKAPPCESCGGTLKPDIVFFGDNVPAARVDLVRRHVDASDSVLVLGSSLFVYSGYRIVLQAVELKRRVAVVNIGETRADQLVELKVAAKCGDVMPKIC